jgi:hypothetical protein
MASGEAMASAVDNISVLRMQDADGRRQRRLVMRLLLR